MDKIRFMVVSGFLGAGKTTTMIALAVQRMMCRDQVNVDVDGRLYDCEVNHVLGLPIQVPADYDGTN